MLGEMRTSRRRAKVPASTDEGDKRMTELQVDLDDEERRVLQVLTEAGRPLEIVELASAALLSISEAQKIVKQLIDKGVAGAVEPEPIRQRVEIDDSALQRVAG